MSSVASELGRGRRECGIFKIFATCSGVCSLPFQGIFYYCQNRQSNANQLAGLSAGPLISTPPEWDLLYMASRGGSGKSKVSKRFCASKNSTENKTQASGERLKAVQSWPWCFGGGAGPLGPWLLAGGFTGSQSDLQGCLALLCSSPWKPITSIPEQAGLTQLPARGRGWARATSLLVVGAILFPYSASFPRGVEVASNRTRVHRPKEWNQEILSGGWAVTPLPEGFLFTQSALV